MIRWELKKLLNPALLLIVFSFIALLWIFLMYLASVSGEQVAIKRFFSYWSVLGSLTLGIFILFFSTKLFCFDSEQRTKEIILATKLGKSRLLAARFLAIVIFIAMIFILLTIIQLTGLLLFVDFEKVAFHKTYLKQLIIIFISSELFAAFTACVCILLSSHTATVTLCAFLFGCTYIIKTNESIFSLNGLLDKGFFSYFIRGESIVSSKVPSFLTWYGLLMILTIVIMLTIQSRRNEL